MALLLRLISRFKFRRDFRYWALAVVGEQNSNFMEIVQSRKNQIDLRNSGRQAFVQDAMQLHPTRRKASSVVKS
jgi:hypothetical protein